MGGTQLAADVERLAESLGELPEPVAEPVLIVVSGLPGTGKSYLTSRLAERLPLTVLESDSLRKIIFSPPRYDTKESSYLFRIIYHLIEKLLAKGISLVLDATNLSERNREYLYCIGDRSGVKIVLVWVEAPPEVVRRRLGSRQEDAGNKSDADWGVYQQMRPVAQKISRKHFVVDTSRDINPVLDKIIKEVRR